MRKVELLAPAGDLEKLKIAVRYGADAVYIGDAHFSLRARSKNFTWDQMEEGICYAHEYGAKVYIASNIFARDSDFCELEKYFIKLKELKADALIISDPGVFDLARELAPDMDIHISTQANTTNSKAALFWYNKGAKRIVCARELSLEEIKTMHENIPASLELESFIHGAMCISYSGRCLLSSFMSNRDANKGKCAHPCRYSYTLIENTRPNEHMAIEEHQNGTYILNSKDLCMINHIHELIDAGINSFKIEGRVKTSYYVGVIVSAYREAIDDYYKDKKLYDSKKQKYLEQITMPSHRQYCTGFYFGHPDDGQVYSTSSYSKNYEFVGIVINYDKKNKLATIEQRNKFKCGELLTVLSPKEQFYEFLLDKMYDLEGNQIESAPHPQQIIKIEIDKEVRGYDMLLTKTK